MNNNLFMSFWFMFLLSNNQQINICNCDVSDFVIADATISKISTAPLAVSVDSNLTGFQILSHSYLSNFTSTISLQNVKMGSNHIIGTNHTSHIIKSSTTRYSISSSDNGKCLDSQINIFPLTSIGYLRYNFVSSLYAGTGFLIGNGLVVSAAHCIYDKENDVFYSSPSIMFRKQTGDAYVATR